MTDARAQSGAHGRDERILVLTPLGRDAQLAEQALRRAGLDAWVCRDLEPLRREIAAGAGVVLVAEEALASESGADPDAWVGPEPAWSQLPLVVLTGGAVSRRVAPLRSLERRRNVTFLERPVSRVTLVSTLRAALESRRRQYVLRDLLETLEAGVRQRDEFLATLGHELRNPLGAVSNAVAILRADTGSASETARGAAGLIERQIRHLGRILDDLLEVSRITRGKLTLQPKPLELGRSVRSAVEASRGQLEERGHRLELALPDRPLWLEADPTRLEQILWNLLGNASKYTDPGGQIHVSVEVRGESAEVRVRDDGRGMSAEFLRRAFDLFAQAEAAGGGGLGLGLPLSRRLAELHGGSLDAASEGLGRGSEFVLRLPLGDTVPPARRSREPQARAAARRVLIVEDHPDMAWSMESLLKRLGHEVRCVESGGRALALAPAYRPEVVLLDIGLPDMHGTEVAIRLRQVLGSQPLLVAMTGFGEESARRRSLASGCDRHMTKPVALAELRELLREAR